MRNPIIVIAEAGVNHNGDIGIARDLILAASEAGADIVKFQTFCGDRLATKAAPLAHYQKKRLTEVEGQREMLKRLELTPEVHQELITQCAQCGIEFLSSAFDDQSVSLLLTFNPKYWKIPSGELTNLPYLRRIGAFHSTVFLSTGMAELSEVEDALNALEKAGTARDHIVILQCTTEYPAPYEEVNLEAMVTMSRYFGVSVGYSDHTPGIEIAIAAAALGAVVIEKHITLDRNLPGPDHQSSLEPPEFSRMISAIRHVTAAHGDGVKRPAPSEMKNRHLVRKSIVASRDIKSGEKFSPDNLTTKRPGNGLSPMRWDEAIGGRALRDYVQDEVIEL